MTTKIIDIENLEDEISKVNLEFRLISDRFIAVSMDYKAYIDKKFQNQFIYELRNNVSYRLHSSIFHFKILLNHLKYINETINQGSNKFDLPFEIDLYKEQITSLFDSLIYHSVSVFDYLSTLTHFILTKKTDNVKWSGFAKKMRAPNDIFSTKKISSVVNQVDHEFVNKLYEYRSKLIHDRPDYGNASFTYSVGSITNPVNANFYSGKLLNKSFSDLKKMSIDSKITIRYAAFWIMRKNIESINKILFAIKVEIDPLKENSIPLFASVNPITNQMEPTSNYYWHTENNSK
jgi:hypothetical protein